MEFWGVEVKAGETLKVQPGDDKLLHLSQAALGQTGKDKGTGLSPVFVKFGDQKLILGSLSVNCPQLSLDLVFEKEFELSHSWKNGSVYFMGYKSLPDNGEEISDYSGDESDEDVPLAVPIENGAKSNVKVVEPIKDEDDSDDSDESEPSDESDSESDDLAKSTETVVKSKVKVVEPIKDEGDSDDSDESDSDDLDSDEDLDDAEDDSDEDDSEDDEETPTPKKAVGNKKRPAESATKTPVSAKKAKATSPQKTDGKKGGHSATPHPAKKGDKSKSPKAGHSKAKHGGRK